MDTSVLILSVSVIAFVYASVGHGGASGYLAALSFIAVRPDEMATTALTLNVGVAAMALLSFKRAGYFDGRLAWPFLAASVPAAFLGGLVPVSRRLYQILLALALGVAALRLAINPPPPGWGGVDPRGREEPTVVRPSVALALPVGGGIGWLSGTVGVGGGIFLSPLLLLLRWATPKQSAAASACFILVNSAAGLGGRALRSGLEYGTVWPLLAAALIGGLCGAHLGARHFSGRTIKQVLAVVLLIAAAKLLTSPGG